MDSTQDGTTPTHLADLVAAAAGRHPDHPALVEDPSTSAVAGHGAAAAGALTWGEFDAAGSAEAGRLVAAGVVAGDRVAIRGSGGSTFAVAVLGALRAGAVVVPLGPGIAGSAAGAVGPVEAVLADCAPRVIVDTAAGRAGDAAAGRAGDAAAGGPGENGAVPVLGSPDLDARADPRAAVGGGADLALLLYTSGSPRGVCLSHRALLANRAQAAALRPAPITPVDRVLLAQPLFHALGLAAGLFQTWWAGATAVLPGPGRPDAQGLVDTVGRHRVSGLVAGPSTYHALLNLPTERLRAGFAGLRLCTCGGALLPATWAEAFRAATGLRIVEGYGLTEAAPVVTSTPIDGVAAAGSVGRPLPGVELRLVDRAGRPLGSGTGAGTGFDAATAAAERVDRVAQVRAAAGRAASEVRAAAPRGVAEVRAAAGRAATEVRAAVRAAAPASDPVGDALDDAHDVEGPVDPTGDTGLIAVRGPNLFSGYWPDRSGGPDAEGWFVTPDLGFLDPSGDLHVVDRSSDLVVVSGFTVYPHEVERVLAELDGVVEAAVVGVPDVKTGQAVRAVVVRTEGTAAGAPDADAVRAHCRARLARFKEPTQVVFVDALPRTPAGRLVRSRLLEAGNVEAGNVEAGN